MEARMTHTHMKAILLDKIRTEWELLEALLLELDERQMLDTSAQAGWSVKDVLAHITFWERLALDRLYAARFSRSMQLELVDSWDVDQLNAKVYGENKDRSLEAVLADTHNTHNEILDFLEGSDAGFVEGPLPFDWAEGYPVWQFVEDNTSGHYKEHRETLEDWIEAQ
jgi:hypothetical protein